MGLDVQKYGVETELILGTTGELVGETVRVQMWRRSGVKWDALSITW